MPDYNSLRATVARLIDSFGSNGKATIVQRIPGAYDPFTDSDAGETANTYDVDCVVLPISNADESTKLDDLAITESVKVLLPQTGIGSPTPSPGDHIRLPSRVDEFTITDVKPLAPDGSGLMWTLLAEKTSDV